MDATEKIKEKLALLREMRQKCIDEKRLPTDTESRDGIDLIKQIEILENR